MLYKTQKEISKNNLSSFKNKTIDVVFDEIDYDCGVFVGRAFFSAPEIDGKVYFESEDVTVNQGETYKIKITKTDCYDLYGRVVDEYSE